MHSKTEYSKSSLNSITSHALETLLVEIKVILWFVSKDSLNPYWVHFNIFENCLM